MPTYKKANEGEGARSLSRAQGFPRLTGTNHKRRSWPQGAACLGPSCQKTRTDWPRGVFGGSFCALSGHPATALTAQGKPVPPLRKIGNTRASNPIFQIFVRLNNEQGLKRGAHGWVRASSAHSRLTNGVCAAQGGGGSVCNAAHSRGAAAASLTSSSAPSLIHFS